MDEIHKQVSRARRRLSLELLLDRLVKCWLATFAAAAIAIAAPKIVVISGVPPRWAAAWLLAAVVIGALAALAWTWLRGRSELDAAVEIDRRFELRERVASSLSLAPEVADSPVGQALIADARRAVTRVAIDQRFPIRLGRSAWLPLFPAVAAFALALLVDNKVAQSSIDPHHAPLTKTQLNNTTESLRKRLAEQRKEAALKGLRSAEELLLELEKRSEKLADRANPDRKQALVKLNDLKKQLEQRRQSLGGHEELRKQLAGMKDLNRGPADKMVDAMKNGDWEQARQELAKLQQEMAAGKMNEAGRQQLERQMAQLEKKLEGAAAQRSRAMDALKKQIEQQKRKGNLAEAGKLQRKLDGLTKKTQQDKQLSNLAKQLSKCQQCMKQGDGKGAAQAMQSMIKQLDNMSQQASESEMLDRAMNEFDMAKDAMACKECNGTGCRACMGDSLRTSSLMGRGNGPGMGRGIGMGTPADKKTTTAFRDSQVKQKPGSGAAVIVGEADGPTIRGNVQTQITEEMAAEGSRPADPMVIEQLPRVQRENAEDYFNRLRDGE